MSTELLRKPRLTDHLLDDLEAAVESIDGDISYLAEALEREDFPLKDALREKFKTRHLALTRAREWLTRHIVATRAQRGEGVSNPEPAAAEPCASVGASTPETHPAVERSAVGFSSNGTDLFGQSAQS